MTRTIAAGVGGAILAATAAVLAPALLRRDTVRYDWVRAFGSEVLEEPIGITHRHDRLYVTDAARNAIVVFDTSGARRAVWPESAVGLRRPMHLAPGADGRLYVAEYLADRIAVLDTAGRRLRIVGGSTGSAPGELDAPGGAAPFGDVVAVVDFYNHRAQLLNDTHPRIIGRPGRFRGGRLHYPTDVAADDSLLYIADAYNHRVQVFRPDGSSVRRWGGPFGLGLPGPLRGWFRVATGLAVREGQVIVADFYNHRVQVFSDRGRYLGQFADSLRLPTDVAAAPGGALYVVDFGNTRVVQLRRRER